jgi:chromosome segregation ATPase
MANESEHNHMDVERAIEFLLKEAARNEARAARHEERAARLEERAARLDERMARHEAAADARLTRLERVMAQNNRVVTRLVRYGVSLRSDVRRLGRAVTVIAEAQAATDENLNTLIGVVEKLVRRNGSTGNGRKRS